MSFRYGNEILRSLRACFRYGNDFGESPPMSFRYGNEILRSLGACFRYGNDFGESPPMSFRYGNEILRSLGACFRYGNDFGESPPPGFRYGNDFGESPWEGFRTVEPSKKGPNERFCAPARSGEAIGMDHYTFSGPPKAPKLSALTKSAEKAGPTRRPGAGDGMKRCRQGHLPPRSPNRRNGPDAVEAKGRKPKRLEAGENDGSGNR